MKRLIILAALLMFAAGCGTESTVQWRPDDPNSPYLFKGAAADTIATVLAQNTKDTQGRRNELQKFNAWLYAGLVLCLVGGMAFWGLTRSRFGWVIPASAVGGIVFITFWSDYSKYVTTAVGVIAMALLIWKAVEYQKERNAETLKITKSK